MRPPHAKNPRKSQAIYKNTSGPGLVRDVTLLTDARGPTERDSQKKFGEELSSTGNRRGNFVELGLS